MATGSISLNHNPKVYNVLVVNPNSNKGIAEGIERMIHQKFGDQKVWQFDKVEHSLLGSNDAL